jgi:biopolymer transport protein ExbB/TolQ
MVDRITYLLLRSSLTWGLAATLAFYLPLRTGLLKNEALERYCAGNWLEGVEVGLFFVAMASLILRLVEVVVQSAKMKKAILPIATGPVPASEAATLLASLESVPLAQQRRCLPRRLRDALRGIVLKGSADDLGEELKDLADAEATQAHVNQALVRIIVWAIPILGILGTVVGMATVTAKVDAQAADESLAAVMSGLGLAFDTTALGLGLSMLLVFVQSLVDRSHQRFLAAVDSRAVEELLGRFQQTGSGASAAGGGESWLRLEGVLKELLQLTKAQHEELQKLGPKLLEAAAGVREGVFQPASSPEQAMRAIAEHPDEAIAALAQAIFQFNTDVARLQRELPAPLSFAGACNLLPARLGPVNTNTKTRRKKPVDRRAA